MSSSSSSLDLFRCRLAHTPIHALPPMIDDSQYTHSCQLGWWASSDTNRVPQTEQVDVMERKKKRDKYRTLHRVKFKNVHHSKNRPWEKKNIYYIRDVELYFFFLLYIRLEQSRKRISRVSLQFHTLTFLLCTWKKKEKKRKQMFKVPLPDSVNELHHPPLL